MHIVQALVLAGGLGSRLGAEVAHLPKPMVDIGGRPFLEILLDRLNEQGTEHVILLCGYRSAVIADRFRGGRHKSMRVDCVVEKEPCGTAGAILNILDSLPEEFLVLNGDSYFAADLAHLVPPPTAGQNWGGIMALAHVPDLGRYGAVTVDRDGRVTAFMEKGGKGPGSINSGIYRLRRDALTAFANAKSLETDVFPEMARQGRLWGVRCEGEFIDIGTPDDLARARREAARLFPQTGATLS